MAPSSEHCEKRLAKDILEYFLRNPNAADDLEGVTHWRLLDQAIHRTLTETKSALEWLVAEGFLNEVSVSGSSHIYALNPQRRDDAEQFICRGDPPTSPKQ
jgi:hypothetical protein